MCMNQNNSFINICIFSSVLISLFPANVLQGDSYRTKPIYLAVLKAKQNDITPCAGTDHRAKWGTTGRCVLSAGVSVLRGHFAWFHSQCFFQRVTCAGFVTVHLFLKVTHKNKSGEVKSGDRGGHRFFENVPSSEEFRIIAADSLVVWHVAPSCWK